MASPPPLPLGPAAVLAGPITDARAFAALLGRVAEVDGDASNLGEVDAIGDFGVRDAWVAAGWPGDGFGPASPTSIDVQSLRGADGIDAFYLPYAVRDEQGRCYLGAVTWSPALADPTAKGSPLVSIVVPGLSYRDCSADVAADEFGVIVGAMHGGYQDGLPIEQG